MCSLDEHGPWLVVSDDESKTLHFHCPCDGAGAFIPLDSFSSSKGSQKSSSSKKFVKRTTFTDYQFSSRRQKAFILPHTCTWR